MSPGTYLNVGEIVQLSPEPGVCKNPMFAGCLMVVTRLREWGATGYVQALGEHMKPGGKAYYHASWESMEPTGGKVQWEIAE